MKFFLCFLFFAVAMTNEAQSIGELTKRYRISGPITLESYRDFEQALKENINIDSLELENSNGSKGYADSIVNLFQVKIEELHLKTYARGYCDSTCAFIFLMGYERTLLPGTADDPTVLRLHAIQNSTTGAYQTFSTNNYIRDIFERSGKKFQKGILMKMYMTTDRFGGVVIKREAENGQAHVFFQKKYGAKLQILSDEKLIDLGISTGD